MIQILTNPNEIIQMEMVNVIEGCDAGKRSVSDFCQLTGEPVPIAVLQIVNERTFSGWDNWAKDTVKSLSQHCIVTMIVSVEYSFFEELDPMETIELNDTLNALADPTTSFTWANERILNEENRLFIQIFMFT